jgi:hypothetical protein
MMGAGYASKRAMAQGRDDWFYRKCLGWQLRFALWPQHCDLSGDIIWLEFGYRGTAVLTGPGEDLVEHRWHNRHEHIIWKIKGY